METEVVGNAKNRHEDEGPQQSVLACLCENRSREVCIAVMHSGRGAELEVYVFADSHSYTETISTLQNVAPDEVLLHDAQRDSVLSKKVKQEAAAQATHGHCMRVVFMSRMFFDQDRGSSSLQTLVTGTVDADIAAKYTVLAGCFCLLRYVETVTGVNFAPKSLRLSFRSGTADRMAIDRRSAVALELISCLRDGNQHSSLFGFLNHTHTPAGARLLRANILRPLVEASTLFA